MLTSVEYILYIRCASCLVSIYSTLDHPGRTCQGVSEEGARVGGGGRERARGREEGHTHEPALHPASGPHLELDTASPRAGRGNFGGGKGTSRRDEREKLSVFYKLSQKDGEFPPLVLTAVRGEFRLWT